jgi:ribosome-binding factor A
MKKTKAPKTNEPSQRQVRVGEEIRHLLADIFMRGDYHAEALKGVSITVTEVDVAPDMRSAIVYVSPLAGALEEKAMVAALNEIDYAFNQQIAKKLAMKFSPRLKFSADNRFDYAEKIERLIQKTHTSSQE